MTPLHDSLTLPEGNFHVGVGVGEVVGGRDVSVCVCVTMSGPVPTTQSTLNVLTDHAWNP